jgi:multiple sugar transport system ATP-binding protein
MHDGVVEQVGKPLELYDTPANLFVAGFIGSPAMNMIKGRLNSQNDSQFIASDGTVLPVANPPASAKGRDLVYGLRPEYIALDPNGLPAEIVVIEPTGYETQMIVRFGGSDVNCIFRERIDARPGDTLRISIDVPHVHLFDAEGGQRLSI